MIDVSKLFGFSAFALSIFSLNLLFGSTVRAQDGAAVVHVDYDNKKPQYDFGMIYGGYKTKESKDAVILRKSLSKTTRMLTEGGNEGGAFEVTLDSSKAEIPIRSKRDFAYMAVGVGINGDLRGGTDFSEFDVADYKLACDAKVENGKPMRQSRVGLQFVTEDGKGPTPDADTEDDVLCILNYAGSQSPVKIELTDEFQTIEVELADMTVNEGSLEQIQKYNARGVTLIVVAEDSPEHFAIGGKTKLIVDNYRLIKK